MTQEEQSEAITRIETTVIFMKEQLLGNGQPGQLTVLRSRVDAIEEFRSVIKGAFAVIAALITMIGGAVITHLFSGNR